MFPYKHDQQTQLAALITLICLSAFDLDVSAQARHNELAKINSYVAEIDRYIKRNEHKHRVLGDLAAYDEKSPRWREFKSEDEREKADDGDNLNQNAYVWTRDGKVIGANFTFQSPSRDWAQIVMYYFRDDGSLAKIKAQQNTFYGDLSVVSSQYFNNAGARIRSTQTFLDLKTQKPTRKRGEFVDQPVPVYHKVSELPFYKLL